MRKHCEVVLNVGPLCFECRCQVKVSLVSQYRWRPCNFYFLFHISYFSACYMKEKMEEEDEKKEEELKKKKRL